MRLPRSGRSRPTCDHVDAQQDERWLVDTIDRAFAPEPERLARTRDRVMAEFRAAATGGDRHAAVHSRTAANRQAAPTAWSVGRLRRVAAGLALAVAVMAVSAGLVAANSGPGQAFYGLRLTVETLGLPAAGTPARFEAELGHLAARMTDVHGAASGHDQGAASAALAAFEAQLAEMLADDNLSGAEIARLDTALAAHAVILARLGSQPTFPSAARAEEALLQVARARAILQELPGAGGTPPGGGGNPAGGGPGTGPANAGSGNGPGNNPGAGGNPGTGSGPGAGGKPGAGNGSGSHGPGTGPGSGGNPDSGDGGGPTRTPDVDHSTRP